MLCALDEPAGSGRARPGIIMLVPGSASLRGVMTLIQQQDVEAYQSAVLGVLMILLALIAGLLFGNLLIPTRRNLEHRSNYAAQTGVFVIAADDYC